MSKTEGRCTLKIMGIVIGTCGSWMVEDNGEDDFYVQADQFEPDHLKTTAPEADVISFHFITGKYKAWDGDGKVIKEGDIFEQIIGA